VKETQRILLDTKVIEEIEAELKASCDNLYRKYQWLVILRTAIDKEETMKTSSGRPLPPTNLFKQDRVRLSKRYKVMMDLLGHGVSENVRARFGTIISDTLSKQVEYITVLWDGNTVPNRKDVYMPDDLELFEEEELVK
jgi:hypothetical protein